MTIPNSEKDIFCTITFTIIPINFEDLNKLTSLIKKEFPNVSIAMVENNIN